MGLQAREFMKQRDNKIIAKKWVKILLSVYKGDDKIYQDLLNDNFNRMNEDEANHILKNQFELLKMRNKFFKNLTFENFVLYSLS